MSEIYAINQRENRLSEILGWQEAIISPKQAAFDHDIDLSSLRARGPCRGHANGGDSSKTRREAKVLGRARAKIEGSRLPLGAVREFQPRDCNQL